MEQWIRESNLIEGVDDPSEDKRSLRAWNWFIQQPLSNDVILGLHRRIMLKKLPGRERGHWRRVNVHVAARDCAHYQYLSELMAEWSLIHSHAKTVQEIKTAHVRFEHIHPFVDGNGRTGRMIMNWQRVHCGLEPLTILAEKRGEYYQWFNEKP